MTKQLQDKVAIVTGASDGIGRGIAEMFAAEGAKTVLVARRAELLDEVAAGIRSAGGEALPAPTDVTQEDQVVALFAKTIKAYGRLDILVNNAGVATHINTEDISLEILAGGARHQYHRRLPVQPRGHQDHEGPEAAGRPHHQHGQRLGQDAASELVALHDDQVCHSGHDASADHGRPQAQHRGVGHPSRRHASADFRRAAAAPRPARVRRSTTTSWPPRTSPRSRC